MLLLWESGVGWDRPAEDTDMKSHDDEDGNNKPYP